MHCNGSTQNFVGGSGGLEDLEHGSKAIGDDAEESVAKTR